MTCSRRGLWGAAALSLTAALIVAGCQDGYPIAATACDRYCDLGVAPFCDHYSPTECVVACEGYWGSERCEGELSSYVACLKKHDYRLQCDYITLTFEEGCEAEFGAWFTCAEAYFERTGRRPP